MTENNHASSACKYLAERTGLKHVSSHAHQDIPSFIFDNPRDSKNKFCRIQTLITLSINNYLAETLYLIITFQLNCLTMIYIKENR